MEITTLSISHISEAAQLFVRNFQELRRQIPVLPDGMQDPETVEKKLDRILTRGSGMAAVEDGRLVGYLSWVYVDRFRDADRKAAYSPEWGHGCVEKKKAEIYKGLYRAASAQWAAAGCQTHAITLLAHDHEAEKTWYWNGFGLAVVDAVRPIQRLDPKPTTDLCIRKAALEDVETLYDLDGEHWQHYSQPPIFMTLRERREREQLAEFLSRPKNSAWLAFDGDTPAGFFTYDGYDFDGVAVINGEDAVFINGAYVRPAYRGRHAAAALLNAALEDYAKQGLTCCALNFESFNPEAANFWMKYFTPVCLSLMRVPENMKLP